MVRIAGALSIPVVGLAAAAILAATLGTAGAATTTTTAPAEWPFRPPAELAARFAPVLAFDSAERFRPVDRPGYVTHADLRLAVDRRFGRDTRRTCLTDPTVASLPERGFRCGPEPVRCPGRTRCYHYLAVDDSAVTDGPGAYLQAQDEMLGQRRPTVYWQANVGQRVIQYWFFYVFNNFANWHAADWEQVTIQFDPAATDAGSIVPLKIGYSSHAGGQSMLWTDLIPGLHRMGTHPLVYVARGSHANYFTTGNHHVPGCTRIAGRFCRDRADGGGDELGPDGYGLRRLTRPAFNGDYSTGDFAAGGRPRLNRGIAIADPQTRGVWASPAGWLSGARPAAP